MRSELFGRRSENGLRATAGPDTLRLHSPVPLRGEGFAEPNPRPMFPNPPGLLRIEPHSEGLRDRICAAFEAIVVLVAEEDVRATEDEGKKNCEDGEQDQRAEEQERYVSAFHTLKERPSG